MFYFAKTISAFFSLFSTYSEGTPVFDSTSQLCCAGKVYDLPEAEIRFQFHCCGTDIYHRYPDPSVLLSICCVDKLYQLVNRTTRCCGKKVYETATHACHSWDDQGGSQVVPLSPEHIKSGKVIVCGRTKDEMKYYNPIVEVCCSGVLYKMKDDMECCGQSYIDLAFSQCCLEYVGDEELGRWKVVNTTVVYRDDVYPECCGGVLIDAEKQMCCEGVVVSFPENITNPEDLYCCGTNLLTDKETQFCVENDHLVAIENRNQVPCGGQLHQISGDEEMDVYCIDEQMWKLGANYWMCSVNGSNTEYDRRKRVCGNNELIDKTGEHVGKLWTYVCTNSTPVDKDSTYVHSCFHYVPPAQLQRKTRNIHLLH